MNDITQSPYFFYGSAANYNGHLCQFGLYEPITDRFVLVTKIKEIAENIALLFSSRYNLLVCDLTSAENFNDKLLDNSCCYNWTIGNKDNLKINEKISSLIIKDTFEVQHIVESDAISEDDLIVADREYLLAAVRWISDVEERKILHGADPFFESEIIMNNLIHLPIRLSSATKIFKEVSNEIFTEYDFCKAKEKIELLLEGIK